MERAARRLARGLLRGVPVVVTLLALGTPGARAQDLLGALESLRASYQALESVHLVASAEIFIGSDPTGTSAAGMGEFEYWAEEDRYRIACRTPPRLGLAPNVQVAFNGALFQLLLEEMATLSIQAADARQLPVALPNPLFLPLDFVSPDDSECDGCALRMTDLKALELWDRRVSAARVDRPAGSNNAGWRSLRMPGGVVEGEPYQYRLFLEDPGPQARLRRIERLSDSDEVLLTIELDDYRLAQGAPFRFPHKINVKLHAPDSDDLAMELTYTIQTLEVDRPLAEEVFTLEVSEDIKIWDSDTRRFVEPDPASLKPKG